ncbi:cytochrome c oxidase subunit II [Candidatus Hodgkinia cicadicola]|uniref:Cytochrome c oxidase subunit 2 n=1 Tax=Candidatus Hodgkinia cicadicola TaxID=573658 RepID=A0ABX4MFZ8_9HYPH|nr:cytochrome c oxidase subunit 2 [Candidatus Hodgkinia cicadicola]
MISVFVGKPLNWQTGLQRSATPVMKQINQLMSFTNVLLSPILIFVVIAIITLCYKNRGNTVISRINKNLPLEIIWTIIPIMILSCICSPSFKALKYQMSQKRLPFITVKVTAHQWYWNYEYHLTDSRFNYNSNILKPHQRIKFKKTNLNLYPELLATDYELVVPSRRVVRILVTSGDVIHGFAVPTFGLKIDAIPGKINDAWIKVAAPGIYYGQCSEFCGKDHSFMPIAVRVVSQEKFNNWLKLARNNLDNAFRIMRYGS